VAQVLVWVAAKGVAWDPAAVVINSLS